MLFIHHIFIPTLKEKKKVVYSPGVWILGSTTCSSQICLPSTGDIFHSIVWNGFQTDSVENANMEPMF